MVWVAPSGSVFAYIGSTDSWGENGRLLKVALLELLPSECARSSFDLGHVQTTLSLASASVSIHYGMAASLSLCFHVDIDSDTIWVERLGSPGHWIDAYVHPVRPFLRRVTTSEEAHAFVGQDPERMEIVVQPDTLFTRSQFVGLVHMNSGSLVDDSLRLQGLIGFRELVADPITGRATGCLVGAGRGMAVTASKLAHRHGPVRVAACADSYPVSQARLQVDKQRSVIAIEVTSGLHETIDSCVGFLERQRLEVGPDPRSDRHQRWWAGFWGRSKIELSGTQDAELISEACACHRYLLASAGRGAYPIKFNGATFNVPDFENGTRYDADYRRWGGSYWFQNTRLMYWCLGPAGDLEFLPALADLYLANLPLARERCRLYFGHGGAFFPEAMTPWGTYNFGNYGWSREGKHVSYVENRYIRWYWLSGIELVHLLLDSHLRRPDIGLLRSHTEPLAREILRFYDEHYPRHDANGHMVMTPAQALETWHEATNPAPDIAGLRAVCRRLAGLAELDRGLRSLVDRVNRRLPDLPRGSRPGGEILLPAERFTMDKNMENPELYAVFPFGLFGVHRAGLGLARRTFAARRHRLSFGWSQDAVQAACLGMASDARRILAGFIAAPFSGYRFPGFWGPNYDWTPDMDHGSSITLATQRMLLQSTAETVDVMPAVPAEWEGSFVLHAHHALRVHGEFSRGRVTRVDLDGASSDAKLAIHDPQVTEAQ